MSSVTGTLGAMGVSTTTFSPAAGTVFTVTIGVWSNAPNPISPVLLVRSQDGINFTPAQALVSTLKDATVPITSAVSIDVVEQRAGVTYALAAVIRPIAPVPFRFDQ